MQPVSPAPIRREIHKAEKKLTALGKEAKDNKTKKKIDLKLRMLRRCDKIVGSVLHL